MSNQAESSLKELPEFEQLEDEGRRTAFAKFIKRQKVRNVPVISR
jgi:hypothetical protein